jgi:hypothetical protein
VPGLGQETAVLSIYNINGRQVKSFSLEKEENSIHINELGPGLYIVVVNYNNELITKKFIKK